MTNDENEAWVAQLRKGTLEMCMLALLKSGERYGYQIAQELTESGGLAVGEGTIYPLLSRLQREGLVTSEWRESPNGPPRKYYGLTTIGLDVLEAKSRTWMQFSQTVNRFIQEARDGRHKG